MEIKWIFSRKACVPGGTGSRQCLGTDGCGLCRSYHGVIRSEKMLHAVISVKSFIQFNQLYSILFNYIEFFLMKCLGA